MKKLLTAIAVSVMTTMAIPAVAQSTDCGMGRGMGPCYQQGPGAGYGPGRQGGQVGTEDRINRRVERLTARLNLSTEQQTQVRTILQEEDTKLAASWKETHDRIATVLNDQQRAQFEQWRAQRGAGGRGMGRGRVTDRVAAMARVQALDRRTEPRRLTLDARVNRYRMSEVNYSQRCLCSRFQLAWEREQ